MNRYTVKLVIRNSLDLKVMALLEERPGFPWTQGNMGKSQESKFEPPHPKQIPQFSDTLSFYCSTPNFIQRSHTIK